MLAFSLKNFKKNTLFFGDSGCFAFACTACVIIYLSSEHGDLNYIYYALPMALPLFDVFFVVVIRLLLSENLLTRNYLHLYQRLQANHPTPLFYLLPQLVSFAGLLWISLILEYTYEAQPF